MIKRLRLMTFPMLMLLFVSCFFIMAHSSPFTYGDVDGNGKIDSTDYVIMRRYVLGVIDSFQYEYAERAADVNGDNMIDSTDCVLMRRYLLGIITEFPVATQPTPSPTPVPSGNITYTLVRAANPTQDQLDAYTRIESAMDTAVSYYNTYTTITKELRVLYEPSVQTADANINGTMRFGSNRSYMNHIIAMHEIAHTVGVGTSSAWRNIIVDGVYTGTHATEELRAITGDRNAVLKGDRQHFWPYGLNYVSEVKSEQDLINHCRIVNAMKKDGI
ncbi:UNVERIFIED_CONTAM: dockerin type I repeat protein [Acetivibrio alkalicellulosi]